MQGPEWAVVIFLFLLLFGAKKIPQLMRSLGRAQGEFQKAKKDFEREVRAGKAEASGSTEAAVDAETPPLPDKDPLVAARRRAEEFGIETEGKDLETLKREIAEKVISEDQDG
ncbi:MAG: twin-arginine translocase TatA/TatE family subunit [Euryarchaeota archaeon]|nr:twin-arginine translocase TatA/TatE family subunit [Euryarchaeota archaeon]